MLYWIVLLLLQLVMSFLRAMYQSLLVSLWMIFLLRKISRATILKIFIGAFLEDATVVSCGHSFGGQLLRKVLETSRCNLCSAEIDSSSLIPNYALRAAAAAVKHEDDRRLFHNAALRKRRKEMGDQMHMVKRQNRENGDTAGDDVLQKGVQYPFAVNEKVVIKVSCLTILLTAS
ncbi:hypothetical protein CsSME_00042701 [Camellia sinensis var. sinensis]